MRWPAIEKPRHRGAFLCLLAALFSLTLAPAMSSRADADTPTVLITGSNRGIGLEFARQYADDGWRVIATCRRPERADELQALAGAHPNLVVEPLDITDHAGVDALAERYRDTSIDVLLNNAALLGEDANQDFGSLDFAAFEQILAVNVIGTMKISERFVENVAASRQKKIVTLGSAAGSHGLLGPVPNLYAYRASKAALHLAMHNLGLELGKRGITVALINPGLVDTRGILDLKPGDDVPDVFKPILPLVESGQIELLRPAESVAAMRRLIATLTPDAAGKFLNEDGAELPW